LRFLLDEGLSPRVGGLLADAGQDAVHARDLDLRSAADPVILQAAVDSHRVLLTLDTDFGTLLAHSGDSIPSVVLFRGNVTRRPERQAALLLANLDQLETTLTEGALVVIGDNRLRIRSLPIEPT
jgi:predicted nuclease of predicted toxin-antitoxin system